MLGAETLVDVSVVTDDVSGDAAACDLVPMSKNVLVWCLGRCAMWQGGQAALVVVFRGMDGWVVAYYVYSVWFCWFVSGLLRLRVLIILLLAL